MNARQVAVEAVKAADEFFDRRLWQRLANEQIVGIELVGRPLIAACVLGAAGQEFGLNLLVGERAVEEMLAIGRGRLGHRSQHSQSLSFSLTRRIDIDPPFDRALIEARRQGRMAPLFFCAERGQLPRPPRKHEYEVLILAARALLVADAAGRLDPGDPELSGRLLTLQVTGALLQPDVAVALHRVAPPRAVTMPEQGDMAPSAELIGLPIRKARYCVALPFLPMTIGGKDELTRVVLVLDATHHKIAAITIVEGDQVAQARDRVLAVLRDGGKSVPAGLPEKMVVADLDLYHELAPRLRAVGVDCDFEQDVPELTDLLESFEEHLQANAAGAESRGAPEPRSPDDLDAWKAVDLEVTNLLAAAGLRAATTNDKTWRRYLGVDRTERDSLLDDFDKSLVSSYIDWYVHHHRATRRSRTVAERVLASDLSVPVRSTLQARQSARHSFYRVEGIKIGEGVEVHDLLADTRCFVTDRSMSMTVEAGSVFPARVYAAGAFSFAMPAGPSMSGVMTAAALDFLAAEHGLLLDDAVAPDGAHLLGRLWGWVRNQLEREITLQNHDGNALCWHSVRFSVTDPHSVTIALEARADIEVVAPGREWIWHRDGVHLGQLELFGGEELVLEVNSAERHLAARRWLEPMAGVKFESVEKKEVDPRRASPPLDDQLPRLGPIGLEQVLPKEALEIVQRMLDDNCMRWLDESIPMLGGKSPRQTCETDAGRRRITHLIRTYPDPMGIPGARVPRERMLAELGLDRARGDEAAES